MKKRVLIIGAGPAGLTAAYELSKNPHYSVTVLESDAVAGGISRTILTQGNRMDIGGHRFFTKDKQIQHWWFSFFPLQGSPSLDDKLLHRRAPLASSGPDPEKRDEVFLIRKRLSRIYYNHSFFNYPLSLSWETIYHLGICTLIKAGFLYCFSCIHKRPETSLENFYINRFGKTLYQLFFESYTEKLWGRHPRDISAEWGAQRVKGLSIWAVLKDASLRLLGCKNKHKETSLIEEFYYPKYGPGQLWATVADKALQQGASILYNTPVTGFEQNCGRITAVYSQEKRFEADLVLSSMPIKDLVQNLPQAPTQVRTIAQGLPYRDFVTVGLLVDKLALPNKTSIPTFQNTIPDCWIYVQDKGVKMGRIQVFNNWSPYLVADCRHKVWLGLEYFCNEGDSFWNMPEQECIELARQELIHIGFIQPQTPVYHAHREQIKKAYPAYFDTYAQMQTVVEYLTSIENLYCIGRNGQHRYNNMDHSMLTALQSVQHILSGQGKKEDIWKVNTEAQYHEQH